MFVLKSKYEYLQKQLISRTDSYDKLVNQLHAEIVLLKWEMKNPPKHEVNERIAGGIIINREICPIENTFCWLYTLSNVQTGDEFFKYETELS